jgi:hypothetical protein
MASREAKHPAVPSFESNFLNTIATAIARRAKALKYHVESFACTRDASAEGEVLQVDIDTLEARATRFRLMTWDDGQLWLGIHQPNPHRQGGWAFAYEGYGNLSEVDPDEVVQMIERTLSEVYGSSRSADTPSEIEKIWLVASLLREQ